MAPAVHPGEVLAETLSERGISQRELARRLGISVKHVNEICNGHAMYSAAMALRLERVLSISASVWMRLRADYELARARAREVG